MRQQKMMAEILCCEDSEVGDFVTMYELGQNWSDGVFSENMLGEIASCLYCDANTPKYGPYVEKLREMAHAAEEAAFQLLKLEQEVVYS